MNRLIRYLGAAACSLGGMGMAALALAELPGDGSAEIWVDGPAALIDGGDRGAPDVAVGADGISIHVWQDSGSLGASTPATEILLRRFDAAGNALADPVIVNTTQDNAQRNPRIAVSADGSFLVIWQSDEPDPQADGQLRRWIRGQAFDADGQPLGSEALYSEISTGSIVDRHADVAALNGGGYAVVWAQNTTVAPDTTARGILGRLAGADGAPSGSPFLVNSSTDSNETLPAVTELGDGGFFASWRSGTDLYGRRFDAAGVPGGDEFQINTPSLGPVGDPDMTRGPDDRILVIWEDGEASGDGNEIRGRFYASDVSPLGDHFRVNAITASSQDHPRAASYADRGFLVVWQSNAGGSAGSDTDGSIEGRLVSGANQFATPQFLVNDYTLNGQFAPATGSFGDRVSVAYEGPTETFEPSTDDAIIGQTWSLCGIFCDRFEASPMPAQF